MACPWPFLAAFDSTVDKPVDTTVNPPVSGKSFAQALSGEVPGDSFQPLRTSKVVMGNSVRVKISQAAYESGLAACRFNLHGRLTLHKGDAPLTTQALKSKLNALWPQLQNWNLIPLGKGFFEFNFNSTEDMKRVWALGVVNLKPGFLRFYCWTKDFAPKAQAQTHAQIWVRFLQLPQEYWGKQTIFEIASGLGTPLTIDEATQNRRFGLFARVLIDVDLSEKMFESVIVEREGHALPIMVQYERHPLFCSHCKAIGHSLQACSKMNASIHAPATRKLPSGSQQAQLNSDLTTRKSSKEVKVVNGHDNAQPHFVAVGNKPAQSLVNIDPIEDSFDSADDFEEGETSGHESVHFNNENLAAVQNSNNGVALNINIQNSFELLANGTEHVTGEAKPSDEEIPPTILDMQLVKNPTVEVISLGKEDLTHHSNLEVPSVKRDPKFVALSSRNSMLDHVNGRQIFPISGPPPLMQSSSIGRLSFPNATVVSLGEARDPFGDDSMTMQTVPAPITTINEILGKDKRKVQPRAGPENLSAACLQDGKLLSKFWGDEDTDATDSTVEPEGNQLPDASPYLISPIASVKKSKKGRPRKQRSPRDQLAANEQAQYYPEHLHNYVHTRSKTGSQSTHTTITPQ